MTADNEVDHAEIAQTAQRTVEREALRKVRKTLDQEQQAREVERKTLRKVLIVCAALALLALLFIASLVFSGREAQKGPAVNLPAAAK